VFVESARVPPVLGGAAAPHANADGHRRGVGRRRRLHRRPLRDQVGLLRGDPAPSHVLQGRDPPDEPRTPALLTGHRRPGFSLRGIEDGEVGASNEIMKIADVLSDSASSGCRRCCTRHHGPEALRRTLRVEALSEPVRDGDRDRALGRMESFGPARSRQKPWPKPTRRARKARTARRVAGSTRGHVISQIGGRRHRRAHAGVVGEQERA